MTRVRSMWPAAGSLVVILVGAFRPWAKRSGLTVDGTDDEIVFVAALAAGVALIVFALTANRRLMAVPLLVGLVSVLVTGHDVSDPAGPFGGPGPNIHLEWGIWVALGGSIALLLASMTLLAETAGVTLRRRLRASTRPAGSRPARKSHGAHCSPRSERQGDHTRLIRDRQLETPLGGDRLQRRAALARRAELVPQLRHYGSLDRVFWPIVTATAKPDFTSPVVNTDHRGHRITRFGDATARSDAPPEEAAFLLGGSYAFGVGASDDSRTLAAALWRRTGVPYVNLGIRAANSAQELASVLPFARRETTFVLCSGLNNIATARGAAGLDPLFGPMHHEAQLRTLASVSIAKVSRLVSDPLALFGEDELHSELKRRRAKRLVKRFPITHQLSKRVRGRFAPPTAIPQSARPEAEPDANAIMMDAAARQIRDLHLLRHLIPHGARVIFALQPLAPYTGKRLSPEEEELFALLDLLQPNRWPQLKLLLENQWPMYATLLQQGCAEADVPFIDLGQGKYTGWCFIDRVHGTDHGYDTAAGLLEELLSA
jgi:hypothetical protein